MTPQRKNDFSQGSIAKNILSLAIPLTVAQLTVVLSVSDSSHGKGGWLMWKQKLMKALLTLFWTVLMLVLLTTKAC